MKTRYSQSGFTLIELLAVMLLMGLIAGATIWTLNDRHREITLEETLDRIQYWDQRIRDVARNTRQPMQLHIDFEGQSLQRVPLSSDLPKGAKLILPSHIKIIRVIEIPTMVSPINDSVMVSAQGISTSYALEFEHPNKNQLNSTWLLIAGATGYSKVIHNEETLQNILQGLRIAGYDAN